MTLLFIVLLVCLVLLACYATLIILGTVWMLGEAIAANVWSESVDRRQCVAAVLEVIAIAYFLCSWVIPTIEDLWTASWS